MTYTLALTPVRCLHIVDHELCYTDIERMEKVAEGLSEVPLAQRVTVPIPAHRTGPQVAP